MVVQQESAISTSDDASETHGKLFWKNTFLQLIASRLQAGSTTVASVTRLLNVHLFQFGIGAFEIGIGLGGWLTPNDLD
ncbi:hypothetical protein [Bradyrhizobium vignae]|uniref:hypothetical protein n=1 Tax=Bradyrhizobium vignae TaxID=1549949 RepID=UPI0011AE7CCE|nr:hypothetical protein [Bradyrhizobium vignae]